jgi:hypothetical protein
MTETPPVPHVTSAVIASEKGTLSEFADRTSIVAAFFSGCGSSQLVSGVR